MSRPYRPIACGLHDELQLRVLRRTPVEVAWSDDEGGAHRRTGPVVDVFSQGGAEFLRLGDGTDVRLDRLVRVDGIPFTGEAC